MLVLPAQVIGDPDPHGSLSALILGAFGIYGQSLSWSPVPRQLANGSPSMTSYKPVGQEGFYHTAAKAGALDDEDGHVGIRTQSHRQTR
jgi:hypothetical protein